jgi:hypothetical protein
LSEAGGFAFAIGPWSFLLAIIAFAPLIWLPARQRRCDHCSSDVQVAAVAVAVAGAIGYR